MLYFCYIYLMLYLFLFNIFAQIELLIIIFRQGLIATEYCSCKISHIWDIFTFRQILRSIKPSLRGNIGVLELNCDVTKARTID